MAYEPVQSRFRFYNDDGSQSAATAAGDQNASIGITDTGGNTTFHLRVGVEETGGTSSTNSPWQLQFRRNGGSWSDVTSSSAFVKAVASTHLTDGDSTTSRLTGAGGTFIGGKVAETGSTANHALVANFHTEHLFSIQTVDADLASGDTLEFQVLHNGTALAGGYTATPSISNVASGSTTGTAAGTGAASATSVAIVGASGAAAGVGAAAAVGGKTAVSSGAAAGVGAAAGASAIILASSAAAAGAGAASGDSALILASSADAAGAGAASAASEAFKPARTASPPESLSAVRSTAGTAFYTQSEAIAASVVRQRNGNPISDRAGDYIQVRV